MFLNIKNNLLIFLLILIILLGIMIYSINARLEAVKEQRDDYKTLNQIHSVEIETWKDKDSLNHSQVEMYELNSKQLFKQAVQQEILLQSLDTKINKLTGYRIQTSDSKYNFYTNLRDSTLYDTIKVKVFEQKDPKGYYDFKGILKGDSIKASLSVVDTIVTGVHKGKCQKRILWKLIGIGDRKYLVENVNKNPFVKTTSSKEVYLSK